MPLKHATETLLVFLLAVMLLLTGVVLRLLPALPGGMLWWALAFVAALLYPLVLYPLMRQRRADYSLRALHFLPAGFLLLWLIGMLGKQWLGMIGGLASVLSWGLGLLPVTLGIALLALYCVQVIRQRNTRLPLLALLFLPFALLGATLENGSLGGGLVASTGSSSSQKTQANLDPSKDPAENTWRGILRRMERRQERLIARDDLFGSSSSLAVRTSSSQAPLIAVSSNRSKLSSSSTSSAMTARSTSSKKLIAAVSSSSRKTVDAPPNLVSSGPVTNTLAILFIAAYCAVLQGRAIKRKDLV